MPEPHIPEAGFVSNSNYVNAFFGFALPLPKDGHFQSEDLSDSDKGLQHFLFAEKSVDKGVTMLLISATRALGSAADEAQAAAFIRGVQGNTAPEALDIGRRLFWKSDVEQKTLVGKIRRLRYTTAASGFVLQFSVSSNNSKLAEELREGIELTKFFDPGKAEEVAGPDSRPFLPQAARMRLANTDKVDLGLLASGTISGNTYENPFLGFSYHFPEGWRVRRAEEAVEDRSPNTEGDRTSSASASSEEECTRILLSAVAPEMGVDGNGLKAKITLLAADPSCFVPDLKFPASVHDQKSIQLYGEALFRAFAGTNFISKDASTIRAVELSGHVFLEVPNKTAIPVPGTSLLRKVHGSFVLTNIRSYWVIWLFESDSESELARMMKTSISFDPRETVLQQAH